MVEFLNEQMPNIEVMAVEIKQFNGASIQTLVPRVLGRIASQAVRRPGTGARPQSLTRWNILDLFATEVRDAAEKLLVVADRHNAAFGPGSRGISIRGRSSSRLVSLAWLYHEPGLIGLGRTRDFSFGAFRSDMDADSGIRDVLSRWISDFGADGFAQDISSPTLPAYAVDHYSAVQHIDVLAERLDKVLSDLKAL